MSFRTRGPRGLPLRTYETGNGRFERVAFFFGLRSPPCTTYTSADAASSAAGDFFPIDFAELLFRSGGAPPPPLSTTSAEQAATNVMK